VKENVIGVIADGKHLRPRQSIVEVKVELQSTLHNMQGDEDQQDECSRILTDIAGERIDLEQETLLHTESQQGMSGLWKYQSGNGQFLSQTQATYISPYSQSRPESRLVDGHFQSNDLFSGDFVIRNY
jgi:hypothetical protein